MSINQIAEGFYKSLTDKEKELYEDRIAICRECKLLKTDSVFGEICNGRLFLNPETNETSQVRKEGFMRGCGCVLRAKTRVKTAKCPLGKWK